MVGAWTLTKVKGKDGDELRNSSSDGHSDVEIAASSIASEPRLQAKSTACFQLRDLARAPVEIHAGLEDALRSQPQGFHSVRVRSIRDGQPYEGAEQASRRPYLPRAVQRGRSESANREALPGDGSHNKGTSCLTFGLRSAIRPSARASSSASTTMRANGHSRAADLLKGCKEDLDTARRRRTPAPLGRNRGSTFCLMVELSIVREQPAHLEGSASWRALQGKGDGRQIRRTNVVARSAARRPSVKGGVSAAGAQRALLGGLHSSGSGVAEPDPDASYVAVAVAGSAAARTRMRCGVPRRPSRELGSAAWCSRSVARGTRPPCGCVRGVCSPGLAVTAPNARFWISPRAAGAYPRAHAPSHQLSSEWRQGGRVRLYVVCTHADPRVQLGVSRAARLLARANPGSDWTAQRPGADSARRASGAPPRAGGAVAPGSCGLRRKSAPTGGAS